MKTKYCKQIAGLFGLVSLLLMCPACDGQGNRDPDYHPVKVLNEPIRPIVDPPIVRADEVDLSDQELVLGVELRGDARAYPINQLTGPYREIINDELAGTAIAATW